MKKLLGITFCILTAAFSFADENSGNIELPDLTTVISGNESDEKKEPAPGFSDTTVKPLAPGELEPELPVKNPDEEITIITAKGSEAVKQMDAKGEIGGGYPASFIGAFSVSRQFGSSPFTLSFNHNSAEGFAHHGAWEEFNTRDTQISIDKVFTVKPFKIGLGGTYENIGNGLQQQAEGISLINQNDVVAHTDFNWNFKNDFNLGTNIAYDYYFHYVDISKNTAEGFSVADWLKGTSQFTVDPAIYFNWSNEHFAAGFNALYVLAVSPSDYFSTLHRGEFTGNFGWHNNMFNVSADVGAVVGNKLNETKAVVPFNLGFAYTKPLFENTKLLKVSLTGGLSSKAASISELEKTYAFTTFSQMPSEQSDWYVHLIADIPFTKALSSSFDVEYRKTAFNNGSWLPDYSNAAPVNGIYDYIQTNRETMRTAATLNYSYKLFFAELSYVANWLDLPVLENKQTVKAGVGVNGREEKWGVKFTTGFSFDAEGEQPELDFDAYFKLPGEVKLMLTVNDLLKLLGSSTPRIYAGNYIRNSGYVTLTAGFIF